MIVQHFPAYNTPVLGYGTEIDVCFSTDTLSLRILGLPFGQNGATVVSSFPAIQVWQIPTSYEFCQHFRYRLTQFI